VWLISLEMTRLATFAGRPGGPDESAALLRFLLTGLALAWSEKSPCPSEGLGEIGYRLSATSRLAGF
jgi:hypothetical protein